MPGISAILSIENEATLATLRHHIFQRHLHFWPELRAKRNAFLSKKKKESAVVRNIIMKTDLFNLRNGLTTTRQLLYRKVSESTLSEKSTESKVNCYEHI